MLSWVHVLEWRAAVTPGAVALTDDCGGELTYAGFVDELASRRIQLTRLVPTLIDVVITGGENVYPAEVEALLASHPQVADVAVIAVPDDRWGETVHAVVVAGPGLDTAELIDWAHRRLAGFKCPTGVSVVAQLPRNATGKVLRSALREPFWAGRDRRVS